jgi:hypothetical protein
VNKLDWRKEIFRATLADTQEAFDEMGIKVESTMALSPRVPSGRAA